MRGCNITLTPSMEDYLEMIYRNCMKEGYVRMTSLAEQLHVQVPSATRIVQKLAEKGLLDYEKYGIIRLTDRGHSVGEFLLKRHEIVEGFLKNIDASESILIETEMIEHYLSPDTVKTLAMINRYFDENPEILEGFLSFKASSWSDSKEEM